MLGLQVGFFIQLLWLIRIPVGAAFIPEGNTAAIVITALIVRFHTPFNFYSLLIICFLYGLLISYLGGELVVLYRKINTKLLRFLIHSIEDGKFKCVSYTTYFSLFFHFILMSLLIYFALIIGQTLLSKLLIILPVSIEAICKFGAIGLLGIGTGLVLSLYKATTPRIALFVGILIGNGLFILITR